MINELIALFDASVFPPVATRYGLATLGERGPLQHVGGDQYVPIAVDNTAPWSYWRVGEIRSSPYDLFTCEPGALHKVTFRLVLLLPNTCNAQSILIAAGNGVASSMPSARTMLGALRAKVVGQRTSTDGVAQQERIDNLPLQWSLLALDVDVEIVGTATCLIGCEDSPSALCAIIATASNANVVECLGDRVNEICEGSGPCQPTTLNGIEIVGTAGIVKQGGVQVGTVDPDTGVVTVPECDPCPVTVSLEGIQIANVTDPCATPSVALECSDLINGIVVEGAGTSAANGFYKYVGDSQSTRIPPGNYGRFEKEGSVYYVESNDLAGDEYYWVICDDTGATLYVLAAPASDPWTATFFTEEGVNPAPTVRQATIGDICECECDPCADATVANSDASYSELIPSGDGLILPDNSISLKDSLGTLISTTPVPATSPAIITAPNGSVQPKDTDGTDIGAPVSVVSGGTAYTTIADSTITLPNGTTAGLKATQPFDVRPYAPMKFVLSIYHALSAVFTITADEAGSYTSWTDGGLSGTWTYSKNGGAFIAATGTVVLAIGDTIQVQRTITTAQGIRRWAH